MADIDDLDNLFEEYESRSRPEGNENVNDDETPVVNEGEERAPEVVPVPVRRIIRPRVKFNPDRLCGERGIPVLTKHFKNVKFKGKGHEKEDLDKLLSNLNHWCHRLFPSMKFEDCLRQIEKLGKKRPVQTCLQKIRLNMPILSNDFIGDGVEREGDGDEVEREGDEPEVQGEVETNPEDAFDRLFNEGSANFTSTPVRPKPTENVLGSSFGSTLTEEQRKRIEYNRSLAIERRKNKLAAMQSTTLEANFDNPSSSNFADMETSHLEENNASSANADKVSKMQSDISASSSNFVDLEPSHLEENNASFANADKISEMQSEISDSLNVNNFEENQNITEKDSEELDIDELMDLVEDDNLSEKNLTENTQSIPSDDHVPESNFKPNSFEGMSIESSEPLFEMSDSVIPGESDGLE